MKTLDKHLKTKLKDKEFAEMFEEERHILELALKIAEARKNSGFTQKELAKKAQVTQQQLSKIENGLNCNIKTFLKVCAALGIKMNLNFHDHTLAA